MKLKHSLLLTASTLFIFLSANSHAGREGVNAYYGLGLGAAAPQSIDILGYFDLDFDPTANMEIILGIEEDGWALEAIASRSIDAGTNLSVLDYNLQTLDLGIGYRTIEKNNRYYKFKYSKTDVDIQLDASGTTATAETEGNSLSFGMGFRMDREERMEVDITYHDNDATKEPIYFVNLRYIWGGAPYHGTAF